MTTTVVKTIGTTGRNYSTLTSWEAAAPTNLPQTRSNTTQAGSTSSTIVFDSGASAVNTDYVGHAVWCDARSSEKRLITSYDGTTKTATIGALNGSSATWDNTPGTEAFTMDSVIWKGECYNDGELTSDNNFTIDGATTDANNYIWLTTAAGQSFMDHANKLTNALKYNVSNGVGVNTTSGGGYVGMLKVADDYTVVEKLQFKGAGYNTTWASSTGCSADIGATGSRVRNCIFENNRAIRLSVISNTAGMVNCLIVKTGTVGSSMPIANFRYPSAGAVMANCTVVLPSDISSTNWIGISTNSTNALVKNCAVFGTATGFSGSFNASCGYNATDAASAPGSNNQTSLTYADQFEDVTNSGGTDYRAKATGSLDGNGTRDQTNTNDLDIVNQARSTTTPTIGAWEVVTGGTNQSLMQISG